MGRLNFAIILAAAGTSVLAQNPVLLSEQVDCLSQHAVEYLEFVDAPTLIFPGFCQLGNYNPSPAEIARATSQNSMGAGAFRFQTDEAIVSVPSNPFASMVVLDGAQIACIGEQIDLIGKTYVEEGERPAMTELILDRCAR